VNIFERLKKDLMETSKFGRATGKKVESYAELDLKDGISRPTGSEGNRKIRDYAVKCMKEAGLNVRIDEIGNIFGRRNGLKTNSGTVMCGSHLDSVINGGMFDGALGVFAGIEAVRRINDEGFENERPLEVVAFTGEEGSAFKQTLLGSSVLTGKTPLHEALSMKNDEGMTLEEALLNIRYKGTHQEPIADVEYMIELHVEQGPVLYNEKTPIGIVENIAGIAWIFVTILGQENHAGTTPMRLRKDALVAASDVICFINHRANEMVEGSGASTVATVGKLDVFPNGINIVPGRTEKGIDVRDVRQDNMQKLIDEILEYVRGVGRKYSIDVSIQMPIVHDPVPLDLEVAKVIETSAKQAGINTTKMNSGAGHDSQNMARMVKTGMIFVPSIDGVSHSPMEWTDWEYIEKGTKVLTQTLKNLSSFSIQK